MERIVAVVDGTGHFASTFCAYANEVKVLPYPLVAFTSLAAYRAGESEYEVVALLIEEEQAKELWEVSTYPVLRLTEGESDAERGTVSRYRDADHLLKEILSRLDVNLLRSGNRAVRMTCVYSPAGGRGQTSFALSYADAAAERGRVLYISLEDYAGLELPGGSEGGDLSEALYAFGSDSPEKRSRILACMSKIKEFEVLRPGRNPEDLEEIGVQELNDFLDYLKSLSMYDELVVDVGHLLHKPWVLLYRSDTVLVPLREGDEAAAAKVRAFREYLEHGNYAGILGRMKEVVLPEVRQLYGLPIGKEQVGIAPYRSIIGELSV